MTTCKNYIATFIDKGYVQFHQCKPEQECIVIFKLSGISPNSIHACHIHEYGDLRDGCNTLGGHLNLTNKPHGSIFININESHTGDLVNNIKSDKDGQVDFSYMDPRLNLFSENSILGCSVVIHDGKDDYGLGNNPESKKTGNAGGRMACAIIGKMKP